MCRRQIKGAPNGQICPGKDRKHCGKRRKCWLPAFSSFPTMFPNGFFFRVVKSEDFHLIISSFANSFNSDTTEIFYELKDFRDHMAYFKNSFGKVLWVYLHFLSRT